MMRDRGSWQAVAVRDDGLGRTGDSDVKRTGPIADMFWRQRQQDFRMDQMGLRKESFWSEQLEDGVPHNGEGKVVSGRNRCWRRFILTTYCV